MRQWYTITAAQGMVVSGRLCRLYGLLRMTTNCMSSSRDELDVIFKQKQMLRTQLRKTLKAIDTSLRSRQDNAIQDIISGVSWFKSSLRLCAYIICSALREVDTFKLPSNILRPQSNMCCEWKIKNSHMRMLNISCVDDLVANLMDILEPDPVDADGQTMLASTLIPQPYSVNHSFHEEDVNMSFGSMLVHGLTLGEKDGDLETCSRAASVLSHILKDNLQSKEEGLGLYSCVMANEKAQNDALSLFPSDVEIGCDQSNYRIGTTLYFELHGPSAQSEELSVDTIPRGENLQNGGSCRLQVQFEKREHCFLFFS